jgi:hypothetical protein
MLVNELNSHALCQKVTAEANSKRSLFYPLCHGFCRACAAPKAQFSALHKNT